jgi:cytidylate kinase
LIVIPVIAIDGPSASGKGTVAQAVAGVLGFHYLDSGALYRIVGVASMDASINLDNEREILAILLKINIKFTQGLVILDGCNVTDAIRREAASDAASRVAAHAKVRAALLERQRAFRLNPGLVADGRDMGSVVFPDAVLKIYLTASVEARAQRRYKQLIDKGLDANMAALLQDIRSRDERDSNRAAAPLKKCPGAVEIDTTGMPAEEAAARVLALYRQVQQAHQVS